MARTNNEKLTAIEVKVNKAKKKVETTEIKHQEALDKLETLMKKRDNTIGTVLFVAFSTGIW